MTHSNGEKPITATDPKEVEREIEKTRDAISEDIRALGAKVSPSALKAEARDAVRAVKDAAVHRVKDAADAAVENAALAKNTAVATAEMLVHGIGQSMGEGRIVVRRASDATRKFARDNALPLSLLGLAAGFIAATTRRRRRNMRGRNSSFVASAALLGVVVGAGVVLRSTRTNSEPVRASDWDDVSSRR
jgi:hypothetical protein